MTIGDGGLSVTRNSGGDITPSINPQIGAHNQFTITTTGYDGFDGMLTLVMDNSLITDEGGNIITGTLPNTNTYTVDRKQPNATAITRTNPNNRKRNR